MLTPIDIQNHTLKTAVRGYSKKETDEFLEQILAGYEELFKENHELKEKVSSLSEGIENYKQMETTLQKALVLAEKTSSETQEAAKNQADAMLREAATKAESIEKEAKAEAESLKKETEAYVEVVKAKANAELSETRNHVRKLVQSYENYRLQFKKLAESQIEMLESENYSIYAPEIDEMLANAAEIDESESESVSYQEDIENITKTEKVIEEDTLENSKEEDLDIAIDTTDDIEALQDEKEQEQDYFLNEEDIDAISKNLQLGFDKMTASEQKEKEDETVAEEKSNEENERTDTFITPKLDDFAGDDTVQSVDPEKVDEDSPFTFIEP